MRVIGIDPGYDRLGIAIVEKDENGNKEKVVFSDCFETNKKEPLPDRMHAAGKYFERILKEYSPDALSLETLFFNQNKKTVMGVSAIRGIIMYLAKEHSCEIFEYHPQEIKVAVTGYGKSDKESVTSMVMQLVSNCPTNAKDDEYDAIAIAITALAHNGRTQ